MEREMERETKGRQRERERERKGGAREREREKIMTKYTDGF